MLVGGGGECDVSVYEGWGLRVLAEFWIRGHCFAGKIV